MLGNQYRREWNISAYMNHSSLYYMLLSRVGYGIVMVVVIVTIPIKWTLKEKFNKNVKPQSHTRHLIVLVWDS